MVIGVPNVLFGSKDESAGSSVALTRRDDGVFVIVATGFGGKATFEVAEHHPISVEWKWTVGRDERPRFGGLRW